MQEITFTIRLEDAMADTLNTLANSNQITPRMFCEQIVEARLAEYRLPFVEPAPLGAHEREYKPVEHALACGPREFRGAE
ncbi:MAG: hypothetical protein WBZ01_21485 [Terriglobales bacterium]|jgi:hypothetical protein